jgi:hypothetical protein
MRRQLPSGGKIADIGSGSNISVFQIDSGIVC